MIPRYRFLFTAFFLVSSFTATTATGDSLKVAHVYVALCDNANQGIVPVPASLGNGQDPVHNLYWGAQYGVKTFLRQSENWNLVLSESDPFPHVLERCVFEYGDGELYLVADAYDGAKIRETVIDFLKAASGTKADSVTIDSSLVIAGGASGLVAYVGHNGLMDFGLASYPAAADTLCRDVVVLACASKAYFARAIDGAGACPLLWTTGLMAPEAYTLAAVIEAWVEGMDSEMIAQKAAEAYNKYQRCGLKAARRLLVTGKPH